MIIAVTGSKEINLEISINRIEKTLQPYLNSKNKWLVGFGGKTDQIVFDKLISNNENVTVIQHISNNEPKEMKELIELNQINLVNPNALQLPKFIDAPSKRDLYMLLNADLSIIFWNSSSIYTKNLIEWYIQKGKNFLVGFLEAD